MRHLAITLLTALLVVGAFLVARAARPTDPAPPEAALAPREPDPKAPEPRTAAVSGSGGVVITGVSELEALHRAHGKLGSAMRDFLALTTGPDWNHVDRERMQKLLHDVRYWTSEEDIPYLLDLFRRTTNPAFRWWFSWAVWQIAQELGARFPGDEFVDPMTEVYRIDKARGYDALATIDRPFAMDRVSKLLDAESEPDLRTHAVNAIARSDWEKKEELLTKLARDAERSGPVRVAALTALGHVSTTEESLAFLVEIALGPAVPVKGLTGGYALSHPIADLRSPAAQSIMLRGDQEAARRLLEAGEKAGIDSDLSRIVDMAVGSFSGPDLSEFIYDRARRRGYVSEGEVNHLIREPERLDRQRLRDLLPLIRDEALRKRVQALIGE